MNKLRNNITLKVFSLFIALSLWVFTIAELDPTIKRTINIGDEVSIRGIDTQNYYVDIEEKDIEIELEGNRSKVLSVQNDDIVLYVDLEGYEEGEHIVKLEMDKNSKLKEVDTTIIPKEIKINIERKLTVNKEVDIKKTGTLKENIDIDKLKIENEKISISGRRSLVESIDKVYADLNLSKVTENSKISFPIKVVDKYDKEIEGLKKSKDNIEISLKEQSTGTIPIEVVTTGELPENLEIESIVSQPSYVNILYKYRNTAEIEKIQTEKIDLKNIQENTELAVKLIKPEGIEIVTTNSVKVKIKVKPKESQYDIIEEKITLNVSDIGVVGLKDGFYVDFDSVDQKNIDVFLKGSKDEVEKAKNSIKLEADFSGVTTVGTHSVLVIADGLSENKLSWRLNPNIVAFVIRERSTN